MEGKEGVRGHSRTHIINYNHKHTNSHTTCWHLRSVFPLDSTVERKMTCGKIKREKDREGGQRNDLRTQGHTDEAGVNVCMRSSL